MAQSLHLQSVARLPLPKTCSSLHWMLWVGIACSSAGCQGDPPASFGTGGAAASGGDSMTGGAGNSGGAATGGDTGSGGADVGSGGNDTNPSGGTSTGSQSGSGGSQAPACNDSFLLCDDFETDSINTSLWSTKKNNSNVVELSSEHAFSGKQSVHLHIEGGYGYIQNSSIFPTANNDYFGRMYLRMARYSEVDWAHWTVAEAAGTGNDSKIRVGGQFRTDQGVNRYGVGSDGGPTGDWTRHDNDPNGSPNEPKVGSWVCLEWEHKGSTNETHMYIDGELHPSLSTSATDHDGTSGAEYILPTVTSLWFGFWQYQTDPEAFDVWIDDVAIDDERIGCGAR